MDWKDVESKWDQVKGLVKEKWGKLTDNDLLEIQGKSEQLKGKLRERYGFTQSEIDAELKEFSSSCQRTFAKRL